MDIFRYFVYYFIFISIITEYKVDIVDMHGRIHSRKSIQYNVKTGRFGSMLFSQGANQLHLRKHTQAY